MKIPIAILCGALAIAAQGEDPLIHGSGAYGGYVTSLDHILAHEGRGATPVEVKKAEAELNLLSHGLCHIDDFLTWLRSRYDIVPKEQ